MTILISFAGGLWVMDIRHQNTTSVNTARVAELSLMLAQNDQRHLARIEAVEEVDRAIVQELVLLREQTNQIAELLERHHERTKNRK